MNDPDLLLERARKSLLAAERLAQYGRHFAKTQALDPIYHNRLSMAFKLRQIADYQVEVAIETDAVSDLIAGCQQFIAAAEKYLAGLQGTLDSLSNPP